MTLRSYDGGCHCGRVRFRVRADLAQVAACNCSICVKKGFLHLIVPHERFEWLSGEGAMSTYTFNTGTARHTFCPVCGVQAVYVPRSDPDKLDVNARCLEGVEVGALRPRLFDGRRWKAAIGGWHAGAEGDVTSGE